MTLVFQKEFEEVLKEVSFAEGGREGRVENQLFPEVSLQGSRHPFPFSGKLKSII